MPRDCCQAALTASLAGDAHILNLAAHHAAGDQEIPNRQQVAKGRILILWPVCEHVQNVLLVALQQHSGDRRREPSLDSPLHPHRTCRQSWDIQCSSPAGSSASKSNQGHIPRPPRPDKNSTCYSSRTTDGCSRPCSRLPSATPGCSPGPTFQAGKTARSEFMPAEDPGSLLLEHDPRSGRRD